MKLTTLAFALTSLAAATASADEAITAAAPPQKTLGVDAMAVLPVGDYANAATLGLGILGRFEAPAGPGFLTGRAGVIFHAMKTTADASLTFVPIYAGYRYPLGTGGAYVAGELGVTLAFGTVETPLGRMSASDRDIGFSLMAGWRKRALDFRAGLFTPNAGDAVGLIASAGYDFAAF
ncbi:MAG: hypothetical protein ABI175_10400 [Polyangiales bacterium]